MNEELILFNNLTRIKEKFLPLNKKSIGMYVCGPTVYDNPHIGNARPLVVFDLLFRVLSYLFGKESIKYVRNITDIDDKIIESSKNKGLDTSELTNNVTKVFHDDCKYLSCLNPTYEPKATEHIKQMIEMTSVLINKKFAYEKNNHVYFEVNKYTDYGKLSNKKLDELEAGARVEISKNKKNPSDFVLWKPSTNEEPGWNSPWGRGRPGWHLECSCMAKKFLGDQFDIHGGGLDLIFPHHENEIAQSVCANDTKYFAKYWIHNGFITMDNEKMAKSLGNIVLINELRKKNHGQTIRLALLGTHYRQPLDWTNELINSSKNILDKWYEQYTKVNETNLFDKDILKPLLDDLNTPAYISNLHVLYEKAKKGSEKEKIQFNSACNLVGLLIEDKNSWQNYKKERVLISEKEILRKIDQRNKARKDKKFSQADKIRDELEKMGILIEDKDDKTSWKYK